MDEYSHIWKPLDSSKAEIRLLRLEPNTDLGAWPVGQLETRSLDDGLHYDAISYSWGHAQEIHPLFIDGEDVPITAHLCGALRYLRHSRRACYFWIDSVCISQSDSDERSSQLMLMRRIFREAQNVRVWLGHESRTVERTLEALVECARDFEKEGGLMNHVCGLIAMGNIDNADLGLEQLARLDFWDRLWPLQEVALARNLTVHYGASSTRRTALNVYTLFSHSVHAYHITPSGRRVHRLLGTLSHLNGVLSRSSTLPAIEKMRIVLALMSWARQKSTSDARDRVYGMLGIISSLFGTDFMQPSYSMTTSAVYTAFAWQSILRTKSLLVLSQATPYNRVTALPSWVPDWSSHYDHAGQVDMLAQWRVFKTFPQPPADFNPRLSGEILRVRGICCGTVARIGCICYPGQMSMSKRAVRTTTLQVLEQWSKLLQSCQNMPGNERQATFSEMEKSFIRTIYLNTYPDSDSVTSTATPYQGLVEPGFEYRRLRSVDGKPAVSNDDELWLATRLRNRRFFVTSDGRPGIGPRHTKIGDTVFVLEGGNMPFILRQKSVRSDEPATDKVPPLASSSNPPRLGTVPTGLRYLVDLHQREPPEGGGQGFKGVSGDGHEKTPKKTPDQPKKTYSLTGVCYVDSIMDGEAVTGPDAVTVEDIFIV